MLTKSLKKACIYFHCLQCIVLGSLHRWNPGRCFLKALLPASYDGIIHRLSQSDILGFDFISFRLSLMLRLKLSHLTQWKSKDSITIHIFVFLAMFPLLTWVHLAKPCRCIRIKTVLPLAFEQVGLHLVLTPHWVRISLSGTRKTELLAWSWSHSG